MEGGCLLNRIERRRLAFWMESCKDGRDRDYHVLSDSTSSETRDEGRFYT